MENVAGKFLKQQLAARQRKNPHYSMRAFARDLGMHPGSLNAVLKGERQLANSAVPTIATALGLSPKKVRQLGLGAWKNQKSEDLVAGLIDDKHELGFEIVAEWEHFAVLSLMQTKDFESSHLFISNRLGISTIRAEVVVGNLMRAGMIRESGSEWTLTNKHLKTPDDIASRALRKAHLEELLLAQDKLQSVPVELREFGSVTLATSRDAIPQIKAALRRFQKELLDLAEGDKSENEDVFQFCLQFFPLTNVDKESQK